MKVDIWSDTRCPFCFIGKRNFENALQEFPHRNDVEVQWHSFQLDQNMKTDITKNHYEYLSEIKGFPMDQVMQMHDHLMKTGKEAGIDFNFDEVKVANSFKSQMLVQWAKENRKADEMEEALFDAFFVKGKNVDDVSELSEIGKHFGFSAEQTEEIVNSPKYAQQIENDIYTASQIGIRGVPFFVFNDKYGVSGAQPPALFLEVLEKSWSEFSKTAPSITTIKEGDSCDIDGNCD